MKDKFYYNKEEKKDNVIYHESKLEATLKNKPYIIPASKPGSYSKLDKALKKEEKKLKKELSDYSKYDI